jgi:hypothetical protein
VIENGRPEQANLGQTFTKSITLKFRNAKFHTGLNWTIRRGLKFATTAPGAEIMMQEEAQDKLDEPRDIGTAVVTHVLVTALADVPPFVFKGIHNPELKNVVLLMDELKKCYGDIAGSDTVTCIGFAQLL